MDWKGTGPGLKVLCANAQDEKHTSEITIDDRREPVRMIFTVSTFHESVNKAKEEAEKFERLIREQVEDPRILAMEEILESVDKGEYKIIQVEKEKNSIIFSGDAIDKGGEITLSDITPEGWRKYANWKDGAN